MFWIKIELNRIIVSTQDKMLRLFVSIMGLIETVAQGSGGGGLNGPPIIFTDTTTFPITGNYTMGYVNNTVENRCHVGKAKFRASQTGIVDTVSMGVYSQAVTEVCGISFALATFPAGTLIGSVLLTTMTDLATPIAGTDEFIPFNASLSSWSVAAGQNYTVTVQPFTWTSPSGPAGTTGTVQHCLFQIPYGRAGLPFAFLGEHGPTGQPCGTTPWTVDLAGDGLAMQLKLTGHPASVVVPSATSTRTPTPTSTMTPTPSQTATPTPTVTPTGTPTITETPTQTLSPGATASNSPTSTRTPSRTPSISYTQTPTSSVTSSVTPTGTPSPTPSLRPGASPSVTPTETPGPTDSHSPQPLAPISIGLTATTPPSAPSAGPIIGAAIGGALVVIGVIGLAIRLKFLSAQLNASATTDPRKAQPKTKTWKNLKHIDKFETVGTKNPLTLRVDQMKRGSGVIEITPV